MALDENAVARKQNLQYRPLHLAHLAPLARRTALRHDIVHLPLRCFDELEVTGEIGRNCCSFEEVPLSRL